MCIIGIVANNKAVISFGLQPNQRITVCPQQSSLSAGLTVFDQEGNKYVGVPFNMFLFGSVETQLIVNRIKQKNECLL